MRGRNRAAGPAGATAPRAKRVGKRAERVPAVEGGRGRLCGGEGYGVRDDPTVDRTPFDDGLIRQERRYSSAMTALATTVLIESDADYRRFRAWAREAHRGQNAHRWLPGRRRRASAVHQATWSRDGAGGIEPDGAAATAGARGRQRASALAPAVSPGCAVLGAIPQRSALIVSPIGRGEDAPYGRTGANAPQAGGAAAPQCEPSSTPSSIAASEAAPSGAGPTAPRDLHALRRATSEAETSKAKRSECPHVEGNEKGGASARR